MSKEFRKVATFNQIVLGIDKRNHGLQTHDEAQLSYIQLKEEAIEYLEALGQDDLPGCIDACIDSIVFAMGILYKMGITEEEFDTMFEVVMNYNMTKKKGVKAGREGHDAADAVHAPGMVKPEEIIRDMLET